MKTINELRLVVRSILQEARRSRKGRKDRKWVPNQIQTNQGKYDGRNDKHRQMLAQDLYKNMTQAQQGCLLYTSPSPRDRQ